MGYYLYNDDCLKVMESLAVAIESGQAGPVQAIITDPPYHLGPRVKRFSDPNSAPPKDYDGGSGVYGRHAKGFMGKEWDGGDVAFNPETWRLAYRLLPPGGHLLSFGGSRTFHRMAVAIEDAGFEIRDTIMWVYGQGFPKSHKVGPGWGTALKPAHEPIVMARKPIAGTVSKNLQTHGVGGLNIEECMVSVGDEKLKSSVGSGFASQMRKNLEEGFRHKDYYKDQGGFVYEPNELGRWPANLIHDGSDEAVEPLGEKSRFFYCAKASASDKLGTNHPTTKPVALMRYLCRLVTPSNGIVLDPFAGSGTTVQAAIEEGFFGIGIERDPAYFADMQNRLGQITA